MALTGIQPSENMQKLKNSLSISKAATQIQLAAAGGASRSHFLMSSYAPHDQYSAKELSEAHKDSPQRSAGSFNMVHPVRRALGSSEQRFTSNIEDDNDENDVLMCWGMPSTDIAVGTPSSPLIPPCFINAYSLEDQPLLHIIPTSNSTIYSQGSELSAPKVLTGSTATSTGSGVTHSSPAESMTATPGCGSSSSLTKQPHLNPGQVSLNKQIKSFQGASVSSSSMYQHVSRDREPAIEKMIRSAELEDDDGLSYFLREEFWAHHEMPCDSDTIFQEEDITINDNAIPTSTSLSAALKSGSTSNGRHSKLIIRKIPACGPPNLSEDADGGQSFESYSPSRAVKLCQPTFFIAQANAPSLKPANRRCVSDMSAGDVPNGKDLIMRVHEADYEGLQLGILKNESQLLAPPLQSLPHPGSIFMAESTGISSCSVIFNSGYEGNIEGKSPLVRSCSLTSIPPTSYQALEESPSVISASSLIQEKKRSFSAVELSSAEISSCQGIIKRRDGIHKMQRRRYGAATDPQSIAARTRREKLSEKIRMLQSLIPNGERLDTVSMLGQTFEYIRFLRYQLGELDHGPDNGSQLLASSKCDNIKWRAFMETHSATTPNNTSSVTSL